VLILSHKELARNRSGKHLTVRSARPVQRFQVRRHAWPGFREYDGAPAVSLRITDLRSPLTLMFPKGTLIDSRRRSSRRGDFNQEIAMRIKYAIVTALAGLVFAALPIWAHHSFAAEFDGAKKIKLQGKVTQMEWINPHTWIHLEVIGANGEPEEWMVEGGTPNVLLRKGFTKKSLEPGTEIIVDGSLARNGKKRASGLSVTFKDGKRLFLGGSNPDDPANKPE
jgi:hypothetical protein